jgi:hypothetical protein
VTVSVTVVLNGVPVPLTLDEEALAAIAAALPARDGRGDGRVWFDVDGAADYLSMPAERLRKLVGRRAIPYHQEAPGCRIFFSRTDLDDWMASSRHAPRGAA